MFADVSFGELLLVAVVLIVGVPTAELPRYAARIASGLRRLRMEKARWHSRLQDIENAHAVAQYHASARKAAFAHTATDAPADDTSHDQQRKTP